jgi:hypothetical protein
VGWSLALAVATAMFQVASMPRALDRAFGSLGVTQATAALTAALGTLVVADRFGAAGAMASLAGGQLVGCVLIQWSARRERGATVPLATAGLFAIAITAPSVALCASDVDAVVPRLLVAALVGGLALREGTLPVALRWARGRVAR